MKKKYYKIDSDFYFIVLLEMKTIIEDNEITLKQINSYVKNKSVQLEIIDVYQDLDMQVSLSKINNLLNCVGAALVQNKKRYYARINDVFPLLIALARFFKYTSFYTSDLQLYLSKILTQNLKEHKNKSKIIRFEKFKYTERYLQILNSEKRNVIWFITNHMKQSQNTPV